MDFLLMVLGVVIAWAIYEGCGFDERGEIQVKKFIVAFVLCLLVLPVFKVGYYEEGEGQTIRNYSVVSFAAWDVIDGTIGTNQD